MPARSNARAAFLAVTMNLVPMAPVDLFRFLRVPAIVMTLRKSCRRCGVRRRCRRFRITRHEKRP